MYCLRCGKERQEENAFCDECLAGMEQEPVPIQTPVVIAAQPPQRAASRRRPVVNLEEELKRMQKFNQRLFLFLILLFTLVILLGILLYEKEFWQPSG